MPCDHLTTMDTPRFVNHFRTLFRGMRGCGLDTPWAREPRWRIPSLLWDTFLTLMTVYMLLCYVYSIMTIYISFQDLCGLGVSAATFVGGLSLTVFHIQCSGRLKKITDHMDSISDTIIRWDLGEVGTFRQSYKANADFMTFFTRMSVFFSAFLPFNYCISPWTDILTGNYRSRFAVKIHSPFDDRQPGVYELVVLIMASAVASSSVKKTITDCLIVSLFNMESNFLKYLSASMISLEKDFLSGDNALVRRKLLLWVRLHQNVVKNIHDLVNTLSPVFIIYYVIMICNIVCAAFIQLMKDNDSIVQTINMSVYVAVALSYLYVLSDSAHQITIEAQKLAEVAYSCPWYQFQKSEAEIIRMIVTNANRPIEVTSYRAPMFILNRETFTGFITTAMSVFITFCQMKDKYDT